MTGINLSDYDNFHRNDIYHCITNNKSSKHLIIVNAQSKDDWNDQIVPLANKFSINLRYGLNLIDNLLIWIYDAPGCPNAHMAFETRYIFLAIDYIAKQFRKPEFNVDKYQDVALLINEFWFDIYQRLKLHRNKQDVFVLDEVYNQQMIIQKRVIETYVMNASDTNYNFYRYQIFKPNTKYLIKFRCSRTGECNQIENFTAGLYDFVNNKIIKYNMYKVNANNEIRFFLGERINGIAFCIYAGLFAHTKGNSIIIDYLDVEESLIP